MGDAENVARLSLNLTAARERAGLMRAQVADVSGVGEYERIERGEIEPTLLTVVRIAAALGTTPAALLDGIE